MLLSLLLTLACREAPTPKGAARTLTLAAYTTPREAYGSSILPAFAAHWKERTGEEVRFEASYQGSGAQARAVREGLKADVVALSLEPDIQVLEEAGLITHDWRQGPHGGMVSRSLAVIAVRPGNPKGLVDWPDLAREDVEVLTPNVRTSGGAMWNVLAIWGAGTRGHAGVPAGDEERATQLLRGIFRRVSVMDKGARESIITFEKGVGDAAITYENEVLEARAEGRELDYVVPPATILIENPVAVVDLYAKESGNEDLARAFVEFLQSPTAQAAFARHGFRPVDESHGPTGLPMPPHLFTVGDLGGWDAVRARVFDKGAAYDQALSAPR